MFRRRLSRPDPSTAVLTALVVARSRDDLLAATLASLQETCLEPDQLRTRVVVLAPAGDEARARCRDVAARAPGVELDEAAELRAAVLRVTGDWLLLVAEGARFVRPWSVSGAVHRLLDERRALAVRFGPRVLAYDAAALRPLARARTFTDPDALEEGLARVRPRLLRRRTRLVEAGAPITVRGDLIPARPARPPCRSSCRVTGTPGSCRRRWPR